MIDIHALLALLDDEVLVRKYLHRFSEDMPGLLRMMRSSFEAQHWNEISIHAHSFKSQMQYINDAEAAGIAYALEKEAASPDPEKVQMERLIMQLEKQLSYALEEIHQIIG